MEEKEREKEVTMEKRARRRTISCNNMKRGEEETKEKELSKEMTL